ncbi:MAG: hypothetical protein WCO93_10225 [bacterium]
MKKLSIFLVMVMILSAGCSKKKQSTTLEGDTDIPLNIVGNIFSSGSFLFPGNAQILQNNGGDLILKTQISLPVGNPLTALIPSSMKDATGNLNTELKFKQTSEGILEYSLNSDQAAFVIVRYDAKVGDKYTLRKGDGNTITRTVTYVSTEDDYFWSMMLIKVITVEQDSRIPGVARIVYNANHKFGMVGVLIYMEDGSVVNLPIYPQNY